MAAETAKIPNAARELIESLQQEAIAADRVSFGHDIVHGGNDVNVTRMKKKRQVHKKYIRKHTMPEAHW